MNLICQWYEPQDERRASELMSVKSRNESSGLFRHCTYIDATERWSYGQFLHYASLHFAGEVCVVANTDIVFDETARLIEKCCDADRILALTRWDSPVSPRMLGHEYSERFFSGTQDVWCFIGGRLPEVGRECPLGTIGCENAFLGELIKHRVEIFNPAIDIRTHHVHSHRADGDDQRPQTYGLYCYPELSCVQSSGLCLVHEWRPGIDTATLQPEIVETARRR